MVYVKNINRKHTHQVKESPWGQKKRKKKKKKQKKKKKKKKSLYASD